MRPPRFRRRRGVRTVPAAPLPWLAVDVLEDPVVRQYRFLLRTAPPDALEAAHAEALPTLGPTVRSALLRTAQDRLVAGQRLTADDTIKLAHRLTQGERRTPGSLLTGYDRVALRRLAQAVIDTEAVFGLFSGYAVWDGAEPSPTVDQPGPNDGFNPHVGVWSNPWDRLDIAAGGNLPSAVGGVEGVAGP